MSRADQHLEDVNKWPRCQAYLGTILGAAGAAVGTYFTHVSYVARHLPASMLSTTILMTSATVAVMFASTIPYNGKPKPIEEHQYTGEVLDDLELGYAED